MSWLELYNHQFDQKLARHADETSRLLIVNFCQFHIILYANNTNETLSEKRTFKKSTQNTYFTRVLHEKHGKVLIIFQYFSQFSCWSQLVYLFKRESRVELPRSAQLHASLRAQKASWVLMTAKLLPHSPTGRQRQPRHWKHRLGLELANSSCMCHHQSPVTDADRRILGCRGRRWTSRWTSD